MVGSPDRDGRPDPGAAGTAAEFVDALRRLKDWAGMGFRRLEKAAAAAGQALPRSTITAALTRDKLPREDLVAALVLACGGDHGEVDRWLAARRRIAAAAPLSASPALPSVPSVPSVPAVGDAQAPAAEVMPGPVRCTLPADQAVFVGRDKELEQITTAVTEVAQHGGVIAIHAIDGMPGIGKTTLAVHVAHQLAHRFGDRQLFLDLHAHTPGRTPVSPSDALAQLLTTDGLDPRYLPDTLDARASLWRDRMAGKQLLLVLDNAAGSHQVTPLLPGSAGSLILITSRRGLGDIPAAVPIPLDVLAEHEAITMFLRLAPRAGTDRHAVAHVTQVCGYLPLAISILASLYQRRRSWTLADLVREVHRTGSGPLTLTAENRTVATVFDVSYHHLPTHRQQLFRLLAGHPGTDIDPHAAAALAGISLPEARQHLDGLHTDHLLEEPLYRRYRMHDLIRAYAQHLAATTDPATTHQHASTRLLDFYRHTAANAMGLAYPYIRQRLPTVSPFTGPTPEHSDRSQATRWLDTELPNLLAAAAYAIEHGWFEHLLHLAAILDRHLRTRGHNRDAQTLHEHAVDFADRLGDRAAKMTAHNGLGYVHWRLSSSERAADHHGRALQIAQAIGDRAGEMDALNGLGDVHRMLGRYELAGDHDRRALQIAQAIGDQGGEVHALTGLGYVHWMLGRYEQAGDHYERASRIAQAIGNTGGESNALSGLGHVHRMVGRYEEAESQFGRALRIAQAIGHRGCEMNALRGLGYVHWMLGRFEQAGDHHGRVLQIAQAIGDRRGELQALTGLGSVHRMTGRYSQAAGCYQQVLVLAQQLHSGNWRYEALQGLGRLHHATGQPDLALTYHEQALQSAIDLTQPADQARAHDGLAHAYHAQDRHEQAQRHWQQALEILTGLGTDHTEDIEANLPAIRAHLAQTIPAD